VPLMPIYNSCFSVQSWYWHFNGVVKLVLWYQPSTLSEEKEKFVDTKGLIRNR